MDQDQVRRCYRGIIRLREGIGDRCTAKHTEANSALTELNLYENKVGDAGAVALADTLKATVVTCAHEFREDALVWCSSMKLKHVMSVCACYLCCFLCLKGTAHQDVPHRCAAPMYLVDVARCND